MWLDYFNQYLEISEDGIPIVNTTVRMRELCSVLRTLTVPYNSSGIGSEGYIAKYSLSVNFFSFLNLHKCF